MFHAIAVGSSVVGLVKHWSGSRASQADEGDSQLDSAKSDNNSDNGEHAGVNIYEVKCASGTDDTIANNRRFRIANTANFEENRHLDRDSEGARNAEAELPKISEEKDKIIQILEAKIASKDRELKELKEVLADRKAISSPDEPIVKNQQMNVREHNDVMISRYSDCLATTTSEDRSTMTENADNETKLGALVTRSASKYEEMQCLDETKETITRQLDDDIAHRMAISNELNVKLAQLTDNVERLKEKQEHLQRKDLGRENTGDLTRSEFDVTHDNVAETMQSIESEQVSEIKQKLDESTMELNDLRLQLTNKTTLIQLLEDNIENKEELICQLKANISEQYDKLQAELVIKDNMIGTLHRQLSYVQSKNSNDDDGEARGMKTVEMEANADNVMHFTNALSTSMTEMRQERTTTDRQDTEQINENVENQGKTSEVSATGFSLQVPGETTAEQRNSESVAVLSFHNNSIVDTSLRQVSSHEQCKQADEIESSFSIETTTVGLDIHENGIIEEDIEVCCDENKSGVNQKAVKDIDDMTISQEELHHFDRDDQEHSIDIQDYRLFDVTDSANKGTFDNNNNKTILLNTKISYGVNEHSDVSALSFTVEETGFSDNQFLGTAQNVSETKELTGEEFLLSDISGRPIEGVVLHPSGKVNMKRSRPGLGELRDFWQKQTNTSRSETTARRSLVYDWSPENNDTVGVKIAALEVSTTDIMWSAQLTLSHILPDDDPVRGITTLNNNVYIIRNPTNERVQVYDIDSMSLCGYIGIPGLGRSSYGLAASPCDNCLYVGDFINDVVHRINLSNTLGENETRIQWKTGAGVTGLSVTRGRNVLVTCWGANKIQEFNSHGVLAREILLSSSDIVCPLHAVLLTTGQFVVVSHGGRAGRPDRVSVIDKYGRLIRSYGNRKAPVTSSSPSTSFNSVQYTVQPLLDGPTCVAVSTRTNSLLVADCQHDRILVLATSTLNRSRDLPLPLPVLEGDNRCRQPRIVHLDESRDQLYIGEEGRGRVFVMDHILLQAEK